MISAESTIGGVATPVKAAARASADAGKSTLADCQPESSVIPLEAAPELARAAEPKPVAKRVDALVDDPAAALPPPIKSASVARREAATTAEEATSTAGA